MRARIGGAASAAVEQMAEGRLPAALRDQRRTQVVAQVEQNPWESLVAESALRGDYCEDGTRINSVQALFAAAVVDADVHTDVRADVHTDGCADD